jgi:two-component system, NtrC family, response regulator AtoC
MIVDEDPRTRQRLCSFLSARGYETLVLGRTDEATSRFQAERPVAVVLDVAAPGNMDGLEALATFKKVDRDVPVIVLCSHACTTTVVQAMKLGAADFVSKPFDPADLEKPVAAALEQRELSRQVASLRHELELEREDLLYGRTKGMADIHALIDQIAETDVSVLIRGERGTGKELVARTLTAASPRRDKPFVKVNCAALPADLLESELFGVERGAFIGAMQQKPGRFEFANHGTLFLDGIGDTSLPIQAKLLQVLQDGEFSRLGGKRDVRVDVRIIAATNRDLNRAVSAGEFREDLYSRLNAVSISLPPLRERRQDIPALTGYFLKKYSVRYHKRYTEMSPEAGRLFMEYDWPGNVRELENMSKRAVVMGGDAAVCREIAHGIAVARALPPAAGRQFPMASQQPAIARRPLSPSTPASGTSASPTPDVAADPARYSLKDISRSAARGAERELILKMLQQTRWNRKETAALLGISYKALLYKIKENRLDKAP